MKKYILALCAACLLVFSASAFAATPEAEVISKDQLAVQNWMDTMLVKGDYKAAWKQFGADGQKAIKEKDLKAKQEEIVKKLGKLQKSQFNAWIRMGQYNRIVYGAQFEKHPIVQCDFFVDQNGQVVDFGLSPIQVQQKDNAAKDKAADKNTKTDKK